MGKRQTTTRMVEKMRKREITIYYVSEAVGDIEDYTLEDFCALFNGENCGYNPETGESDETLISDNNFIYLTKEEALKKSKELRKEDWKEEKKKEVADFFGGEVNDKV